MIFFTNKQSIQCIAGNMSITLSSKKYGNLLTSENIYQFSLKMPHAVKIKLIYYLYFL